MARTCLRVVLLMIVGMVLASCAAQTPQQEFDPEALENREAGADPESASPPPSQSPDSFVVDPETLEFGRYMEEEVDNFLVILDASGSKFLPYQQQIKLKVAKDITRRFNQKTPERPLFGGLRRYGWVPATFQTGSQEKVEVFKHLYYEDGNRRNPGLYRFRMRP